MKNFYFMMTSKALVVLTMLFCVLSLDAQTVTVPAANTNTGSVNDPFGTYWGFERSAMIYTAAQIGTTGTITSVGFYVNSVATPGNAVNVRIYMKLRTTLFAANSTYATETTGATLVYGPVTIPAASFVTGNWITIPLATNFVYTGGANNLEVIVETNATGAGNEGSTGKQFRYNTTGNALANCHYQLWNADNTAPAGNGTRSANRPNIRLGFQSNYQSQLISMNTGSPNWCAGETRNVSITLRNIGTLPWTDVAGVDFNVGIKWNSDPDYLVRVDALNLAPGATATYTLTITAPMTVGSENLTFDVVREGCFWFASNSTACGYTAGPGNIIFVSAAQNIKQLPVVNAGIDDTICPTETATLNGSATTNSVLTTGSATFNYSGSGFDNTNFLIGGTTSGMPAGATITGISFNATIGPNCGSWYEWDLMVNSVYIVSGCNGTGFTYAGLNGQPANGQLLQLRSWDLDIADYVTMTFDVTVSYTYLAPVPITYDWTPGPLVSNTTITNPTTSPPITTNYTLTATADGCASSDMMTVVVEDCSGLPVELSAFSVNCEDGYGLISWATESEQDCDYFQVEMSRDGQTDWQIIGTKPGAGDSHTHLEYSIVDENTVAGTSYYRLKQIDTDGATKIYGPISLYCDSDGIILYPNPAHSSFVVQIQASHPDIMAFSMRDATGKLILEKNLTLKNGTNQFPIEDLSCGSGVYFVSIVKDDGTSEIMRIVIE